MLRSKRRLIDTVVFDLGAVLIGWDPRNLYRKLTSDDKKIESFLHEVGFAEWNSLQDAGRPFSEAVRELSSKFPHHREWIEFYQTRWDEMITGPIEGTVQILEELAARGLVNCSKSHAASGSSSKKLRLFALTNWSAETFPYALKTFPFFRHFEGIVVSGVEKLIKPDPRFYQILLDRYGIDPKSSVFIDDVERNVQAARHLGFEALLFRDPKELRAQLEQLDLLKPV